MLPAGDDVAFEHTAVVDGDEVPVGDRVVLRAVHTPGHTPPTAIAGSTSSSRRVPHTVATAAGPRLAFDVLVTACSPSPSDA